MTVFRALRDCVVVEGVGIVFLRETVILDHINTINVFLLFSLNYSGEFFKGEDYGKLYCLF